MTSEWPNYDLYMEQYQKHSRDLNDVLYRMCSELSGHVDRGKVRAKVWLIGRSYASGLERHAVNGLDSIIDALYASRRWLDRNLEDLNRCGLVPADEHVRKVASLHGRVLAALTEYTRGGNQVRSFVSKYLHFHAPIVPIYDSVVVGRLQQRGWYPWSSSWTVRYPTPPDVDREYWRLCVRVARVAEDWKREGLAPTARNIDTYLYFYR